MSYYLQSKIHGIGNLRKENFFGLNGKLMYLEKFFIIIIIIIVIIIIIIIISSSSSSSSGSSINFWHHSFMRA